MKLLGIENFKCFRVRQDIPLGQLTVLAGSNSVGKSTVIQALLLSRICLEKIQPQSLIVNGVMTTNNSVKIPLNKKFSLSLGSTLDVLNREADEELITFEFADNPQGFFATGIVLHASTEQAIYSLDFKYFIGRIDGVEDYAINKDEFYYLNAERIGPRLVYNMEDTDYLHVGWSGELTIQVLGRNAIQLVPESRCFTSQTPMTLLDQSRLWLEFIAPGTRLDDAQIYSKIKSAEVKFGESQPTNVGFGLSYVLPIIVQGLVAEKGAMFIVENPEAHLHPSGQSNIGRFLARIAASGVQVVIETHSEHVINGIRLSALENYISYDQVQINFFDRDEKNLMRVNSIQLNKKADLSEWPKGFFDQQERDLAAIFRIKRQR